MTVPILVALTILCLAWIWHERVLYNRNRRAARGMFDAQIDSCAQAPPAEVVPIRPEERPPRRSA